MNFSEESYKADNAESDPKMDETVEKENNEGALDEIVEIDESLADLISNAESPLGSFLAGVVEQEAGVAKLALLADAANRGGLPFETLQNIDEEDVPEAKELLTMAMDDSKSDADRRKVIRQLYDL